MKLLHYLIEILFVLAALWGIYNAQVSEDKFVMSLWPLDSEMHINTKLVLFIFLTYGFVWGKINSWFGAAPVRKELKLQRKTNKALNKEQEKLNETVSGLKQNIAGLEQQAKANAEVQKSAESKEIGKIQQWFVSIKNKFARKESK